MISAFSCRNTTLSIRRLANKFSTHSPPRSNINGSNRGPITFLSLSLTAICCGGLYIYFTIEKEKITQRTTTANVITTGKPALGGPWHLFDQNGRSRASESFQGNFNLLYFGFTHCPDICPSELVKIQKVLQEVNKGGTNDVKAIFISVDPFRDTVGQLKHYSQDFSNDITFLTGTPDQVAMATRAYRVYFSKADAVAADDVQDEEYLVDHSIVIYLLSPDGEFLDFFTQRMQIGDIVDKIKKARITENRSKV